MNATINQNSQKRSKYLAVSPSKSKISQRLLFPCFQISGQLPAIRNPQIANVSNRKFGWCCFLFPSPFSFQHYSPLPSPPPQVLLLLCSVVAALGAKIDLQSTLVCFNKTLCCISISIYTLNNSNNDFRLGPHLSNSDWAVTLRTLMRGYHLSLALFCFINIYVQSKSVLATLTFLTMIQNLTSLPRMLLLNTELIIGRVDMTSLLL